MSLATTRQPSQPSKDQRKKKEPKILHINLNLPEEIQFQVSSWVQLFLSVLTMRQDQELIPVPGNIQHLTKSVKLQCILKLSCRSLPSFYVSIILFYHCSICHMLSSFITVHSKIKFDVHHHRHQPTLNNCSLVASEANTSANSLNNNIKVIPTFD